MFDKLIKCLHILAKYGGTLLLPEQQRTPDWRRISRVERDFEENVECFEVCNIVHTNYIEHKLTADCLLRVDFLHDFHTCDKMWSLVNRSACHN